MLLIVIIVILDFGCLCHSFSIRPIEAVNSEGEVAVYPVNAQIVAEAVPGASGQECQKSNNCVPGKSLLPGASPKEKTSKIAQDAAAKAKAASEAQTIAGEAAAHEVKVELAEKALQSARAAEAALAGKQQIVDQLEKEHQEALAVIEDVSHSLIGTQANAATASDVVHEAKNQLNALMRMLQESKAHLCSIEGIFDGAQQELAEKSQLLEAAKNRVMRISEQLRQARNDYEKTKEAAFKATCSAMEAKQRASGNQ